MPCCAQGTVQGRVHWWSTHHFEDILHLGNTQFQPSQFMGHWILFSIVAQIWRPCGLQTIRGQSREGIMGWHGSPGSPGEKKSRLAWSKVLYHAIPIDPLQTNSDFAWPFRISIGMHIPHFISPVPTSSAESQWWSRQRRTSSGSRRVSTAISPWYLGEIDGFSEHPAVCNHLWFIYYICFICIYLYLMRANAVTGTSGGWFHLWNDL